MSVWRRPPPVGKVSGRLARSLTLAARWAPLLRTDRRPSGGARASSGRTRREVRPRSIKESRARAPGRRPFLPILPPRPQQRRPPSSSLSLRPQLRRPPFASMGLDAFRTRYNAKCVVFLSRACCSSDLRVLNPALTPFALSSSPPLGLPAANMWSLVSPVSAAVSSVLTSPTCDSEVLPAGLSQRLTLLLFALPGAAWSVTPTTWRALATLSSTELLASPVAFRAASRPPCPPVRLPVRSPRPRLPTVRPS